MSGGAGCEYLEWDSGFFGVRVARLSAERLRPESVGPVLAWCREHAIECLYFLADPADATTVRLAEDHGFRLVDIRVTLERRLDAASSKAEGKRSATLRPALPDDTPALRAIARVSHRDSRFYYDGRFPPERCDALYETWIERSCQGWADTVLVALAGGRPAGYVSCHRRGEAAGQIGLVGVAAEAQGEGLGRHLVEGALGWFAARGVGLVTVVTQGRNARAQRLYQRCGFVTRSMRLWYHRWFPRSGGDAG